MTYGPSRTRSAAGRAWRPGTSARLRVPASTARRAARTTARRGRATDCQRRQAQDQCGDDDGTGPDGTRGMRLIAPEIRRSSMTALSVKNTSSLLTLMLAAPRPSTNAACASGTRSRARASATAASAAVSSQGTMTCASASASGRQSLTFGPIHAHRRGQEAPQLGAVRVQERAGNTSATQPASVARER